MADAIKCFFVRKTGKVDLFRRRFVYSTKGKPCPSGGYHNAMQFMERRDAEWMEHDGRKYLNDIEADKNTGDWNFKCSCGYQFSDEDEYQIFQQQVYADENGKEYHLRDIPVGGMYYLDHLEGEKKYCGPDGKSLCVMTPDGEWLIDSRAKNCTMPNDKEHKCWVRHGIPPNITVDKNGRTCGAGAGSFMRKTWHGFLRGGYLVRA